jgi:hypothetical protein
MSSPRNTYVEKHLARSVPGVTPQSRDRDQTPIDSQGAEKPVQEPVRVTGAAGSDRR